MAELGNATKEEIDPLANNGQEPPPVPSARTDMRFGQMIALKVFTSDLR